MSRDALANIIPDKPPMVNRKMKPRAKTIGVVNRMVPPKRVANQEKILIPVGTAMIIVEAVK
jgi:hypothetical protein